MTLTVSILAIVFAFLTIGFGCRGVFMQPVNSVTKSQGFPLFSSLLIFVGIMLLIIGLFVLSGWLIDGQEITDFI